jgi:hypothetical protein
MAECPYELVHSPAGTVARVRICGSSILSSPLLNRGDGIHPDERQALGDHDEAVSERNAALGVLRSCTRGGSLTITPTGCARSTRTCRARRRLCWPPRSRQCGSRAARMRDQRVVIHGAGTAGIGIADMMADVMVREGLAREEATRRFYTLDRERLSPTTASRRCATSRFRTLAQRHLRWDFSLPSTGACGRLLRSRSHR